MSVHPNVLLADDYGCGLLKLHICKSIRLSAESAEFIASILHHYAIGTLGMSASPNLPTVIDVFAAKIYMGIGTRIVPLDRVVETCRLLRGAWDAA